TAYTQGYANGHAHQHQTNEDDEQQRCNHDLACQRRTHMPSKRRLRVVDRMGSHMLYHQVGTPMDGEVSRHSNSSRAMRPDRMAMPTKNSRLMPMPNRARRR